MSVIVGYVGYREAEPILVEGLRRLEHRSYDSAGLATVTGQQLHLRKLAGQVADLAGHLARRPAPGCLGIGHLRWATHGKVTDANAHPHVSNSGLVAIVHNGLIENHAALKRQLHEKGVAFKSETDTEVIAELIACHFQGDLLEAVCKVLPLLRGTYALAAVSPHDPDLIVGARLGSPLLLGVGEGEHFLVSDANALVSKTRRVVQLKDGQLCVLNRREWRIRDGLCGRTPAGIQRHDREGADGGKGGYEHHMLKEIHEQPEALENTMRGRFNEAEASAHFGDLNLSLKQLRRTERLILTGCGTSYHAAQVGEYLFEEFARLPVEVEYASELRYRNAPIEQNTILIAITRSGESPDTLAALRESKRKGQPTLAVCNVVGSTIAREADGTIYLHAGPELGEASTKAFTSQVCALAILALYFGRLRHLSSLQGAQIVHELLAMPETLRSTLACEEGVRRIAERFAGAPGFLYLGRQYLYPVALEGALKLRQTSCLRAEGYPAGELKHGPIALFDRQTPSVFLIPRGPVYHKTMKNLEEVRAGGGRVIAVSSFDDGAASCRAEEVIYVPDCPAYLQPLVTAVPLQLLAYHIARLRGWEVDKYRHRATSLLVQ
jgi:glucosamine--fructose-6-phosphate aminotransferase (isomerizing)